MADRTSRGLESPKGCAVGLSSRPLSHKEVLRYPALRGLSPSAEPMVVRAVAGLRGGRCVHARTFAQLRWMPPWLLLFRKSLHSAANWADSMNNCDRVNRLLEALWIVPLRLIPKLP